LREKLTVSFLFLTFCTLSFSAPVFTPKIDGIKEAEWGDTPDATSEGEGFDNDSCKYLYITEAIQHLITHQPPLKAPHQQTY
jgi:hypothetical protein